MYGFLVDTPNLIALAALFVVAGAYVAVEDSIERALAVDLLPVELRGTGLGLLATINGTGDLVSSIIVGMLRTSVSASAGFVYASVFSIIGSVMMLRVKAPVN